MTRNWSFHFVVCRSIYTTSEVFAFLVDELGQLAYDGGQEQRTGGLRCFTNLLMKKQRKKILKKFKTGDKLECLVSTIAFRMGVNISEIMQSIKFLHNLRKYIYSFLLLKCLYNYIE